MTAPAPPLPPTPSGIEVRAAVTIRFAGDSGDGMQLAGSQFTHTSALAGNHVSTLPEYPAEIRAPAGSLAGVSGFQVRFGSEPTRTPGDRLDCLVAMNPAALRVNLKDLLPGGLLVANQDAFQPAEWHKAGYSANPLTDGSLAQYQVVAPAMTSLTRAAVASLNLAPRVADRSRNFFALGLLYWVYERPLEPTLRWVRSQLVQNPAVLEADARALRAGYAFGESGGQTPTRYRVPPAATPPGRYRKVSGTEATVLGLFTAAQQAGVKLFFAGHPITPASDLLHRLAELCRPGVQAFQAEDEAAAAGAALGAAFAGALGVTATSGPGMSRIAELTGLAVMAELPLLVIDVQRAGPSTGLPTRTEQADLFQALFGRHGECPAVVLAPASPADCFAVVREAARIAVRYMTPVFVLSDSYLANGSEPWRVPPVGELPGFTIHKATTPNAEKEGSPAFLPYHRDERGARPWAVPGTPGLEHRIGGLEKEPETGNVSYDPAHHEAMVAARAAKIDGIADDIPPLEVHGPGAGDLLLVSWGSTFGSVRAAVERTQGRTVAHAHLRYLNPLPKNTGDVLARYRRVLVPELNAGQLRALLRGRFLVDCVGLNKMQGKPFLVSEVEEAILGLTRPGAGGGTPR